MFIVALQSVPTTLPEPPPDNVPAASAEGLVPPDEIPLPPPEEELVASEEASSGYPLNPSLPEDEDGVPPEEDGPLPAPPSPDPVDEGE